MRLWRIGTILALGLVLALSAACSTSGKDQEEIQLIEAKRGNLVISVTGSGSIRVADEAMLSFSIAGIIDKFYVAEGNKVNKGDVLAQLDTQALELALARSEATKIQAGVAQAQAEAGKTQAEAAKAQAEVAKAQAEAAKAQAEATKAQAEVAKAQGELAKKQAEYDLDYQQKLFRATPERIEIAELQVAVAEQQIEAAELQIGAAELQIGVAELQIGAAELQIEMAEQQIKVAELQIEASQNQLELAEQSIAYDREQIDRVKLTAPFAGTITSVSAREGDSVTPGRQVIYLIDPSILELQVGVDEIDITSVKLGQKAVIEVDALPDAKLDGKVTSIGLLPQIEAGVVLYDVTIALSSPEKNSLKIGMSAATDIIVNERSNVLLVPTRAIGQDSQGNPVVKISVNGQTQERAVVIGVSDGSQTEIVSGLSEGDLVEEVQAKPKSSGLFFNE